MSYSYAYFVEILREEDTPEKVRKAYLSLSKQVHPDLHPELGKEPMQILNNAYEAVLKDWDKRSYTAKDKDGKESTQTYGYSESFEKRVMDIIYWAQTSPYTEDIELIGLWIWISGSNKDNCPFKAPKCEKDATGKWVPTEEDKRPSWPATDGTPVRFEWSKSNKRWYLDARKLYTRRHDGKVRTAVGITYAREKYGTTRFSKHEEGGSLTRVG